VRRNAGLAGFFWFPIGGLIFIYFLLKKTFLPASFHRIPHLLESRHQVAHWQVARAKEHGMIQNDHRISFQHRNKSVAFDDDHVQIPVVEDYDRTPHSPTDVGLTEQAQLIAEKVFATPLINWSIQQRVKFLLQEHAFQAGLAILGFGAWGAFTLHEVRHMGYLG
jgi:hypothetical protein